ncbi:phage baseplate assembly protein V [Pyramidobacter piscolens]|uniref:phage baseplate assembly protein V n=1 Tax=Pyramidobacter piscolens TaxID=638849 RepID=UPI00266BECBA|nr:phage baseplate assembly protein V [Pyramidobacter piscolens]
MKSGTGGTIRVGEVSAIYPERGTARVYLPDLNVVTDECPVIVPAAVKSRDYRMPEVGETVIAAFLGNGVESGFILGCLYNEKDRALVADADVRHWTMEGAGAIEFNRREGSVLIVDASGSVIKMSGGDIVLQAAANIHLNPGGAEIPAHLSTIFD